MKLSVKTDIFKEMVSRSIKGAGMSNLLPVTGMMAIQLKDNKLTLITTDMSNYLYIKHDNIVGDDFYVVVQVEQFSKLIGKMTCETITLEVEDGVMNVKGNGNYKIELPLDEEGNTITFTDPVADLKVDETKDINVATIKTILNTIKSALAVTMEIPVYTRYYMGKRVIATDTFKISSLDVDVLAADPLLISAETMNLLDVITYEKINFSKIDDVLLFSTPDCIVYGHTMDGVDDFQVKEITELLEQESTSRCKLEKTALLAILDRIGLFVGQYDNKEIVLTFADSSVDISSKTSSGVETLKYVESDNSLPYTCHVAIDMLTTQLKASAADAINLYYGDGYLKIVDGDVTQIIAEIQAEAE